MSAALAMISNTADMIHSEDDANHHQHTYLAALLCGDPTAFSTRNLLTGILEAFFPLETARQYTVRLFDEFGTFTGIINASYERLRQIAPLGRDIWIRLQTIKVSITLSLREAIKDQPVLGNFDRVREYLTMTLGHETVESSRLLFLNSTNKLIRDELHSRGDVNRTMFYPQQMIRRACELHASALIVAHNHPSGDPTPSREDIDLTKQIQNTLHSISITLHDHIIVGKHKIFSFYNAGLLK